jgi:hypothetical protein
MALPALDRKDPRSMRRHTLNPTPLVAAAACALLVAACGGGGSPGVASITARTTAGAATTTQTGAVAFSGCLRSHGVPNFPDPPSLGARATKPTLQQLGVSASQLAAASGACKRLLPVSDGSTPEQTAQQQRTQIADALSFAGCMRSHGVTRFPDPSAQGGLSVEMVQAQGVDVHSPEVLHVIQTCLPASHGALTPAKVRESLNNAGG